MDKETAKKQKVTTFKLTEELTQALDAIAERESCTKDAAIRKMIQLGLETDEEIQVLRRDASRRVARRESEPHHPPARRSSRG